MSVLIEYFIPHSSCFHVEEPQVTLLMSLSPSLYPSEEMRKGRVNYQISGAQEKKLGTKLCS